VGFQHRQTNIVTAATKQKGEEEGGGETHTAVRRNLNSSQKQAIIANHFSK
jgi:hypothetical protein